MSTREHGAPNEQAWTSPGDLAELFPFEPEDEDEDSDEELGGVGELGFLFAFHDFNPRDRRLVFFFGYEDNGALYDQHHDYSDALALVLPEFDLNCETAEAMHEVVVPDGHTEESMKVLMRERFQACGVVEMRD